MDALFSLLTPNELAFGLMVAVVAGVIKGMVGFAMPMILISGLGSVISPELALAGLILPTLVTNGMQALRQGWRAAKDSIVRFRRFLLVGLLVLLAAAQLVTLVSDRVLFLLIGVPVLGFTVLQLAGWRPPLPKGGTPKSEASVGAIAGFVGGLSGVWGPPTVLYLTAIGTEKTEQMRVQGVIYGLGAVALLVAHMSSGVVRVETVPFSAALVVPAVLGMWLGGLVQDRIDQKAFRRATLLVLLVAGANLIRRGLMG